MNILEQLRPQFDAMHEIYRVAYAEGRRSAFAEVKSQLDRLTAIVEEIAPNFLKNEGAETLSKRQEKSHHVPESDQAGSRQAV